MIGGRVPEALVWELEVLATEIGVVVTLPLLVLEPGVDMMEPNKEVDVSIDSKE